VANLLISCRKLVGRHTRRIRLSNHSGFTDVSNLYLFETGFVMFSATDVGGTEGLFSIRPSLGPSTAAGTALPLMSADDSVAPPLHAILTVSVTADQNGRLAYLGGPIESLASGQIPWTPTSASHSGLTDCEHVRRGRDGFECLRLLSVLSTAITAEAIQLSLELLVSWFLFDRPDPVRFFGNIGFFCGRFGTTLILRKITETP
jgi:hypothetical protein